MKNFIKTNRLVVGIIGTVMALSVAIIYWIIVPSDARETRGIERFLLTKMHALCWVFLAVSFFLWSIKRPKKYVKAFAYLGLGCYSVFMLAFLKAALL